MATLGTFVAGQVLTAAELNAIGTWQTWTPTVYQSSALTTSTVGQYCQINELVIAFALIDINSSGTAGQQVQVTLPVNCYQTSDTIPLGTGTIYKGVGATTHDGTWVQDAGTQRVVFSTDVTGSSRWGATPPVGLDSSSFLRLVLTYKA